MKQVLVLYVPALHAGYISLFEKYLGKKLFLLDESVLKQFPKLDMEIRAIAPEKMLPILQQSGYFSEVVLADDAQLKALANTDSEIILSTEYISDQLIEQYFAKNKTKQELVFLRFDEKEVKKARKEIPFDGEVTEDELHRTILGKAVEISEKSSDWFLRPAAAIIANGKMVALTHNKRMPTAQDVWMVGDPRMYVEYGTDTSQKASIHAEQAVIAHAAKTGARIEGGAIYATVFPCPDCCNVIAVAGLKTCYFIDGYSSLSSLDVFKSYGVKLIKVKMDDSPAASSTDQTSPQPDQPAR
jgi:deoxycytidylate deaminase